MIKPTITFEDFDKVDIRVLTPLKEATLGSNIK